MKNVMFGLLLLVSTTAEAAVMCGVFEGSRCETPLYYMQFCAKITFRQKYCERLCARQEPICGVEDFTPWVQAYEDIGRRGIRGDLQSHADEFDTAGTLLYLSQKTVTVCARGPIGIWLPIKAPKVCPKAGAATTDSCTAGTRFNPTTGTCVVIDSTGGSGTQDFQNLMGQSSMLVATQNQHFGENPETSTDASFSAVTANVTPGLTQHTKAQNPDGGILGSLAGTFKSEKSKSASKGSSTSSATGISGSNTTTPDSVRDTASGDQVYASADTAKDSYRASGGGVAGGSAGGGASWFGNAGSAAPGAATSGDIGFNGKASRGLASSGDVLNIEDPANYFMMSDIDVSLFKRVTAQCRRKEKELN